MYVHMYRHTNTHTHTCTLIFTCTFSDMYVKKKDACPLTDPQLHTPVSFKVHTHIYTHKTLRALDPHPATPSATSQRCTQRDIKAYNPATNIDEDPHPVFHWADSQSCNDPQKNVRKATCVTHSGLDAHTDTRTYKHRVTTPELTRGSTSPPREV